PFAVDRLHAFVTDRGKGDAQGQLIAGSAHLLRGIHVHDHVDERNAASRLAQRSADVPAGPPGTDAAATPVHAAGSLQSVVPTWRTERSKTRGFYVFPPLTAEVGLSLCCRLHDDRPWAAQAREKSPCRPER